MNFRHRSQGGGGGRRSLKRLRRCAPQILARAARQHKQCQYFLESCLQRRHWLHYSFCYYYGGHAASGSSWLMTAGTLYALWNDIHAGSSAQCYALSIMMISGIAGPWCYGPWMGVVLGVAMPAFMPCQICPPHRTPGGCEDFQRVHGCHACDRKNCWHTKPSCRFYNRARVEHGDALLGDTVPHMRETRITCTADGVQVSGAELHSAESAGVVQGWVFHSVNVIFKNHSYSWYFYSITNRIPHIRWNLCKSCQTYSLSIPSPARY